MQDEHNTERAEDTAPPDETAPPLDDGRPANGAGADDGPPADGASANRAEADDPDPASGASADRTETDDPHPASGAGANRAEADDIDRLQRERDEYYERLLRTAADFDNYRKRTDRERRELAERAATALLTDLLPLVDDLERALAADARDGDVDRRGVEIIHKQLLDLLAARGGRDHRGTGSRLRPESAPGGGTRAERGTPRRRGHRGVAPGLHPARPAAPGVVGQGSQGVTTHDYYETLGVPRTADEAAIKSAYRKLALRYHPDRNPDDKTAEERFKEAAEAYAILADSDKRSRYDRFGHAGVGGSAGGAGGYDPTIFADFGDILGGLGDLFGFGGGTRRGGVQRGADLRYDLEIPFEEAATGTETTLQIPREEPCDTCSGSGATPGTTPQTCSHCRGRGQIRFQQGFFTVARTCPHCGGVGRIITNPCQTCHGNGRIARERKLTVKIPAGNRDSPATPSLRGRRTRWSRWSARRPVRGRSRP